MAAYYSQVLMKIKFMSIVYVLKEVKKKDILYEASYHVIEFTQHSHNLKK